MPTPPDDHDERLARQRVEENPTDLALRLHLGRCLVHHRKYKEAIAELQKARHHPRHRREAMQLMARSFAALGLSDQAEQTTRQIDSEDFGDDNPEDDGGFGGTHSPRKPIKPTDAGGQGAVSDDTLGS